MRFITSRGLGLATLGVFMCASAQAATPNDPYKPGTRNGPFVATVRSLGELTKDGYEIKANLGNALILQKGGSVFSCSIPPDPEHLSYRSYFVCSELKEQFGYSGKAEHAPVPAPTMDPVPDMPRLKMEKPQQ